MHCRTTRSVVSFRSPFDLAGISMQQPPGNYEIEIEEEELQGLSFLAFRRTGIKLLLPVRDPVGRSIQDFIAVSPHDFDAALAMDQSTKASTGKK